MEDLQTIIERTQQAYQQSKNKNDSSKKTDSHSSNDKCPECKGTGWILYVKKINEEFYEYAKECNCAEKIKLNNRIVSSSIPDEFIDCKFSNYVKNNPIQNKMYETASDYLKTLKDAPIDDRKQKDTAIQKLGSFGFIATYGEQLIKELPTQQKAEVLRKHNSYGLGKTHLQAAQAKWLMNKGFTVWMVSDVVFMDDLTKSKMQNDQGESFNKLMHKAINVDFLVWDDIGKSKTTEAKEAIYYQIINERYKSKKPIIFSSNEDENTLRNKIGFATGSRLIGMSKSFLLACEGNDYRFGS
ncbi:ATP-binding protein [Arthrobacter citreus]|nr:ATP-binding protein [Arthrobacter citreus]